jgi:hypothetical protein
VDIKETVVQISLVENKMHESVLILIALFTHSFYAICCSYNRGTPNNVFTNQNDNTNEFFCVII